MLSFTTVLMMMGQILLLVISTALAAPQGNYSHDYLEGTILERSAVPNPLLEERAINTCGCAPVSSADRIVGGNEVNPCCPTKSFSSLACQMAVVVHAEAQSSTRGLSSLPRTAGSLRRPTCG